MIWPDYSAWAWAGLALVILATLVVSGWSWWARWSDAVGMKFPTRGRATAVKRGWRARLVHLPLVLRIAAVLLVAVAVTRPQLAKDETAEVEGIDIVVALDLSGSMHTVDISDQDLVRLQNRGIEPTDRFAAAIETLRKFFASRKYDRVGLVGFGKDAFLFFPLTLDYGVMLRVLQGLKLGDIDGSGTAIGNALAMSLSRLKESEAKTRVVILITDGEDNGSNVSPMELAREAARQDIKVFTILVGSEGDQRQPTDMVDFATGKRLYQKVAQPVNPKLLSDIAEATRASFYRATDPDSLERDFQTILDTFEKTRLVDYAAAERTELFNRFLLPAIALILLEILLSQTLLRRFP
jgi:Ca-activated chloride channel family protein